MDATADLEEYKFMFKQRLISGIILVLIAAFGLYMGGIVTFAMTLIVALIGYSEILRIYHIEKSSLAVTDIQARFFIMWHCYLILINGPQRSLFYF